MKRSARIARAPRGWHPEEIKAAIRMRGTNMAELSRQHGYGESAVHQALRRPYPAMERIVADHLGVTPEAIWPDRYGPDGTPNRGRSGDASLYRTAQSVSGKPDTRFTDRTAKTTSATASSRNSAAPSGPRGEVSSPVEALRAPASLRLVSSKECPMDIMTKHGLILAIAARTGLQKDQVGAVVDAMSAVIVEETAEGRDVAIRGFGRFSPRVYAARAGRNPATGLSIEISARATLGFRPSPSLSREA